MLRITFDRFAGFSCNEVASKFSGRLDARRQHRALATAPSKLWRCRAKITPADAVVDKKRPHGGGLTIGKPHKNLPLWPLGQSGQGGDGDLIHIKASGNDAAKSIAKIPINATHLKIRAGFWRLSSFVDKLHPSALRHKIFFRQPLLQLLRLGVIDKVDKISANAGILISLSKLRNGFALGGLRDTQPDHAIHEEMWITGRGHN